MRVELNNFRLEDVNGGIIPAYAGRTSSFKGVFEIFWDHPRVCG